MIEYEFVVVTISRWFVETVSQGQHGNGTFLFSKKLNKNGEWYKKIIWWFEV